MEFVQNNLCFTPEDESENKLVADLRSCLSGRGKSIVARSQVQWVPISLSLPQQSSSLFSDTQTGIHTITEKIKANN